MIIRLSFFISGCILGCKQYKHLIINIICGAGGNLYGHFGGGGQAAPEACRVVGPLQGGAQHNRLRGLRQCPARGGPAHALLRKAAGLCPDAEGSAFVHRIPSKHASRRGRTVQARSGLLHEAP